MSAVTDRIRSSCDQCANAKIRCDSKRPMCLNCCRRDRSCKYSILRQSGRPRRVTSAQDNEGTNKEPVKRAEKDARTIAAGQHRASTTTIVSSSSPSSSAVAVAAPDLISNSRYVKTQATLDREVLNYADHDQCTGSLDTNANVDFLDSLDLIPEHYFASASTETDFPMDIYNAVHNRAYEDTFTNIEQSLTSADQSTPRSYSPTDSSRVEQDVQSPHEDSRIISSVNGTVNSPLYHRCLRCITELRELCPHPTSYDGSDDDQPCRCPTMISKLYIVVMDPKLSRPTETLPLDLVLFLEQALHNTFETMTHCDTCASSILSSANGITMCIVAEWIANGIQVALQAEIDKLASKKRPHSLWNCPERHAMDQHRSNTSHFLTAPPSLDVRNSVRIGMWSASSDAWALCVSAILARRIKRMQHMFSTLDGSSTEVGQMENNTTPARANREMAKDISARAGILLGMAKSWESECHIRC